MKTKPVVRKTVLSLYLDMETKEKLRREAKENGRSLSGQVVRMLRAKLLE